MSTSFSVTTSAGVEVEGKGRADSKHGTQGDAVKRGKTVAKTNPSELLVHGRNGRIRDAIRTVAIHAKARGR